MRLKDMRAPTKQPKFRQYVTKSRAGHYTASLRDAQGVRVFIQDKLPTLEAARATLAKAAGEQA